MELIKKKYLVFCIVVLIPKTIYSQYFDNKIDLNISYNYTLPIGSKNFENDISHIQYTESYMFTNQKQLYGYNISIYYNLQKQSYGFEYVSNNYSTKAQNEQYTRYNNISLTVHSYRLAFSTDILKQKEIINPNTKLKFYIKPQLSIINYTNNTDSYTISGINGTDNSTAPDFIYLSDDILHEKIYAPGLAISTKLASKLNQTIGVFIEYEIDLLFVNSVVYSDKFFFTNSLRFGFTLNLFKNKRYYYN